jgi:aldose 1-epimerase
VNGQLYSLTDQFIHYEENFLIEESLNKYSQWRISKKILNGIIEGLNMRFGKLTNFTGMLLMLAIVSLLAACSNTGDGEMKIKREGFGKLSDGREVEILTLIHPDGSTVEITNFGAAVVAVKVPDKNGNIEDVVLGFDDIENYEKIRAFYGAIVGRYGNRIAKGKFTLNGADYQVPVNDGENSLHGGFNGFDRMIWTIEDFDVNSSAFVKLSYLSKDGEEGYPGNMKVIVTYSYTLANELKIDYEITTDKPTVKNVTNHAYFNLSGNVKDDILDHELMLNCDTYSPVVPGLIPTGEAAPVEGTPMDFRKPEKIGLRINEENEQLKLGLGYDHNWIINDTDGGLKLAGTVYEPVSGRFMEIYTTEPSIQFYSGNFMDGSHAGHAGRVYKYREAMCLETQHYPDSPNHENFPTTTLNPGEVYTSQTVYKFSAR